MARVKAANDKKEQFRKEMVLKCKSNIRGSNALRKRLGNGFLGGRGGRAFLVETQFVNGPFAQIIGLIFCRNVGRYRYR